jgi:hypothetical protein
VRSAGNSSGQPSWGGYSFGPLKPRAGRRVVDFADLIVPDLHKHLHALPDGAPLVFTSPTGSPVVNSSFRARVWLPALEVTGLPASFPDSRQFLPIFRLLGSANPVRQGERRADTRPRAALRRAAQQRSENGTRGRAQRTAVLSRAARPVGRSVLAAFIARRDDPPPDAAP